MLAWTFLCSQRPSWTPSSSTCFFLLRAWITSICHHIQLNLTFPGWWWHMPLTAALGRWRQPEFDLEPTCWKEKNSFWGLSSDHHTCTLLLTPTQIKQNLKCFIKNAINSSFASYWLLKFSSAMKSRVLLYIPEGLLRISELLGLLAILGCFACWQGFSQLNDYLQ